MKRVLSAGVVLLVSASVLAAWVQDKPSPQSGNEVVKEAKPKSSKKASAGKKTARTSSSKPANEKTTPATQDASTANAPDAKDAASYYEIGMGHYQSKRFRDAVEAFKQAIRLGSTDPKTFFNLGQAYFSLNRFREARESFKRAVKYQPDWAEAHFQLGWMYHILGDRDSAQAQHKILQTLNPELAASFEKLLIDTVAVDSNAPNNSTTATKETAPTNTPEAAAARKNQEAALPAETQPTAAALVSTSTPANTSETKPGSTGNNAPVVPAANSNDASEKPSASQSASESAKTETPASELPVGGSELPPTSIYRVGIGDVLDIRLLNTPTSRSTLFTVMSGGLIEYPLIGGTLTVAGLTTDEIGARLTAELKRRGIGDGSQVVVGVRDYTSHAVIISGLVNYPGKKILSREAVPLYVIAAEAQLRPDAGRAVIMRSSESIPVNDLADPMSLNVLVRPGDVITVAARQLQYYFIGGRINSPGQKVYQSGLTLIQAILAAGGLSRSQETVEISREEPDGRLTTTKYVLKEIKAGKVPDPHLQPGDRIEVGH